MGFEVKALSPGFYGTRRRKGDTFTVADEKDFSANWMERLPEKSKPVEAVEQAEQPEKPKKRKKKEQ